MENTLKSDFSHPQKWVVCPWKIKKSNVIFCYLYGVLVKKKKSQNRFSCERRIINKKASKRRRRRRRSHVENSHMDYVCHASNEILGSIIWQD